MPPPNTSYPLGTDPSMYGAYSSAGTPASGGGQPFDMNIMLRAFAQAMLQNSAMGPLRNQTQRDVLLGRHLGIGGGEGSTSGGGASPDPFSAEGLFHGGFAAQMPQYLLEQSQGNTAVNQWKRPDMFGPNVGPQTNQQKGNVLSTGMGQPNTSGMSSFDSPQGEGAFQYDPRFDRNEGTTGILARYSPALGGGGKAKSNAKPPTATGTRKGSSFRMF